MKRFLLMLTIGLACASLFGAMAEAGRSGGASSRMVLALAVAALVMWLIAQFRKPQRPAVPCAAPVTATASCAGNIPPDFPLEDFLLSARTAFIGLLAAKNSRDLSHIRDYTTPQILAAVAGTRRCAATDQGDCNQRRAAASGQRGRYGDCQCAFHRTIVRKQRRTGRRG